MFERVHWNLSIIKIPTLAFGLTMKNILYLIPLLPFLCNAQFKQPSGAPLEKVIILSSADSASKDMLFTKVSKWIAVTYSSGKAVTDLSNQVSGVIVAKPLISATWRANFVATASPLTIQFTLQVEVKQGRIRVTANGYKYSNNATPFEYRIVTNNRQPSFSGYGAKLMEREWDAAQTAIESDWQNTIAGLQKAINEKQADW